jgi:hypothetical protein
MVYTWKWGSVTRASCGLPGPNQRISKHLKPREQSLLWQDLQEQHTGKNSTTLPMEPQWEHMMC